MKIVDEYDHRKYIEEKQTFIKAVGGDGTLIRAIHKFGKLNKPFFGVAAGTANFLMNDELKINRDTATKLTFHMLQAEIYYTEIIDDPMLGLYSETNKIETVYAFNDIIIGEFNAWIDFSCTHQENILGDFKGAGLLISTAQGSTGANKNNNGTIIPLSSQNWVVSGVMTNRNISYVIEPNELLIECKSRGNIKINVDGKHFEANNVEKVIITKSNITVDVIFNDLKKFQDKRK